MENFNFSCKLPNELIVYILARLPVKSLCRFKCVNKQWRSLIFHPLFAKSHLSQTQKPKLIVSSLSSSSIYSIDYEVSSDSLVQIQKPDKYFGKDILGSLNGLILLDAFLNCFFLWNPSTREYKKIPCPDLSDGIVMFGFGYSSATDEYKMVRAVRPISAHNYDPTVVYVFNVKNDSWNKIKDFDYKMHAGGNGIIVNDAPHWVVSHDPERKRDFCSIINVIVCFDVAKEEFKEVPLPDVVRENTMIELGVLRGSLSMIRDDDDRINIEIWLMMEYRVKESWTKLFVVPHVLGSMSFHSLIPVCFTKEEDVILAIDSSKLVIYNPKLNRFKQIRIPSCSEFRVDTYVESLVSPNGSMASSSNSNYIGI